MQSRIFEKHTFPWGVLTILETTCKQMQPTWCKHMKKPRTKQKKAHKQQKPTINWHFPSKTNFKESYYPLIFRDKKSRICIACHKLLKRPFHYNPKKRKERLRAPKAPIWTKWVESDSEKCEVSENPHQNSGQFSNQNNSSLSFFGKKVLVFFISVLQDSLGAKNFKFLTQK